MVDAADSKSVARKGVLVRVRPGAVKLPLEYHETREYVSDDQDSRYEITYRYNRLA
jgi:hypothetical protein